MSQDTTWQELESAVRNAVAAKWGVPCNPETIETVKCDGVAKVAPDRWILVEITKGETLQKRRDDFAKFGLMRLGLMAKSIYPECYFITLDDPKSIRGQDDPGFIRVFGYKDFLNYLIGHDLYVEQRLKRPFGSAIDPDKGTPDAIPFTEIKYYDGDGKAYAVDDIAGLLINRKKVVLTGEFGTGKSRCLMELFNFLIRKKTRYFPLAINLRDNWGYHRFSHILQNHFDDLGVSEFNDAVLRTMAAGNGLILLDGFDEIGTQVWGGDAARLAETRMKALAGVRDLFDRCQSSGILITGREHYFNSSSEMRECVGLPDDYIQLRCPDEFTEDQVQEYISNAIQADVIPEWMPRKPLICRLLARLEGAKVKELQDRSSGEVEFFQLIFDAICEREARISSNIFADTVKKILLLLANQSREKPEEAERLTSAEINKAFFKAAGFSAIDESAVMLQRLPYLGRIEADSTDRVFVDPYAKDGLRGLAFVEGFYESSDVMASMEFIQPLGEFGAEIASERLHFGESEIKYIQKTQTGRNLQIAADYAAIINGQVKESYDYHKLFVSNGNIRSLSFVSSKHCDLSIDNCFIEKMDIDDAEFVDVVVSNSIIAKLGGVGSQERLPSNFIDCEIGEFEPLSTVSRISETDFSNAHKTLLAIIKKLFFQSGAARKAEALLRGTERYWDKAAADQIIRYLLANKIIRIVEGKEGDLYKPQRRHTHRMSQLMELRAMAKDELWEMLR